MRHVQAGTMLRGAVMYGFIIAFSGELSSASNLHWNFFILGFWNTLLIVVTALVVVDSIRKVRADETRALATGALVVKVASIPFFLLNFYVLSFVTDIAAGALLFAHSRRRPGLALVSVWVAFGLFLVALGLTGPLDFVQLDLGWLIISGVVVIVATIVIALVRRLTLRRRLELSPAASVADQEIGS